MKHTKQYSRTGVGLLCNGRQIAFNVYQGTNFSITNCTYCGMDVETTGHSPATDKVFETDGPSGDAITIDAPSRPVNIRTYGTTHNITTVKTRR